MCVALSCCALACGGSGSVAGVAGNPGGPAGAQAQTAAGAAGLAAGSGGAGRSAPGAEAAAVGGAGRSAAGAAAAAGGGAGAEAGAPAAAGGAGTSAGAGAGGAAGAASPMQADLPPGVSALFPGPNARDICVDAPLYLRFPSAPRLGSSGKIKVMKMSGETAASVDLAAQRTGETVTVTVLQKIGRLDILSLK